MSYIIKSFTKGKCQAIISQFLALHIKSFKTLMIKNMPIWRVKIFIIKKRFMIMMNQSPLKKFNH